MEAHCQLWSHCGQEVVGRIPAISGARMTRQGDNSDKMVDTKQTSATPPQPHAHSNTTMKTTVLANWQCHCDDSQPMDPTSKEATCQFSTTALTLDALKRILCLISAWPGNKE